MTGTRCDQSMMSERLNSRCLFGPECPDRTIDSRPNVLNREHDHDARGDFSGGLLFGGRLTRLASRRNSMELPRISGRPCECSIAVRGRK